MISQGKRLKHEPLIEKKRVSERERENAFGTLTLVSNLWAELLEH
jgi:hypothetical protein